MAKKKRTSSGANDVLSTLQGIIEGIPDEVREQLLEQLLGPGAGAALASSAAPSGRKKSGRRKPSADPCEAALDLVEEAQQTDDVDERVRLTIEALRIDPDCAEAHLLLGDAAPTAAEAADSYREAMQAAERRLGPAAFQEYAGHFWGFIETRPYMAARERLAEALWAAGRRDEALTHYEALLELNPNDNQGVRQILASHDIEAGRFDALEKLLDRYPDDSSPELSYARPLLTFRRQGDVPAAREQLRRAFDLNRYVPEYLLGESPLPLERPEWITAGGKDEAIAYVFTARIAWSSVPEALAWLRETIDPWRPARRKQRVAKAKPFRWKAAEKRRLTALEPDANSVWQAAVRPLPAAFSKIDVGGDWAVVVDFKHGLPLALIPVDDISQVAAVGKALLDSMLDPGEGRPRRPRVVEFDDEATSAALRSALAEIGVAAETKPALKAVDGLPERLAEVTAGGAGSDLPSPTEFVADTLSDLPRSKNETWEVDQRRMPTWIKQGGRILRPASTMIVSSRMEVIAQTIRPERATLTDMWSVVADAMLRPMSGSSRRPEAIEVLDDEWARFFRARCEPLSIDVRIVPTMPSLDAWMKKLAERSGERGPPAVSDIPGFTVERGASLFEAAAAFHRAAPWRTIPADQLFRFQLVAAPGALWYGVVMGQSGLERGLALYPSLEDLRSLLSGRVRTPRDARRVTALSFMYGEAHEAAFNDLDLVERHAWPVAAPEAHPLMLRLNNGKPTTAGLDELMIVDGALRLFADERRRPGKEPVRIALAFGDVSHEVELSRVE